VFSVDDRKLKFSGGGHAPAMLLDHNAKVQELDGTGPPIGITDVLPFENASVDVPPDTQLLLYSDGAVEIDQPDGDIAGQDDFNAFVAGLGVRDGLMEALLKRARAMRQQDVLNDDVSLMQVAF